MDYATGVDRLVRLYGFLRRPDIKDRTARLFAEAVVGMALRDFGVEVPGPGPAPRPEPETITAH